MTLHRFAPPHDPLAPLGEDLLRQIEALLISHEDQKQQRESTESGQKPTQVLKRPA